MTSLRQATTLAAWPLVALCGLALAGCGRNATEAAPARARGEDAVAVRVAKVVARAMPVNVRAVGNVEPSSTVDVRAQVTGMLQRVHFREGEDVRAGDVLFTIDPRPFEAALRQAEAAQARDIARSKNLEAQRDRLKSLVSQGLIAQAEFDAAAAEAAAMAASIDAGAAAIESARLQLQYTRIAAPVDGRTGALLVHEGALVRVNDATPLVVINRLAPAFVSFAVPARLLPRIRQEQRRSRLAVTAAPSGDAVASATGQLTFVDNVVDAATDTIRLKATFENRDRRLWPGAFVDVTLRMAVEARALVVPAAAVQPGQQGQFVYVVSPQQTADARPIKIAWTDGDLVVVESGLAEGELVVTDGQLRLSPGARVAVTDGTKDGTR
jgi:multidrug efflux system membrane fusion protein